MKYEQIIDDSILYIKEHINEDLTAQTIANYVGYSVFHFCRIFSLVTNLTVMEYIRKYRLSIVRMNNTDSTFIKNIGEVLSPPEIIQKKSFKMAGYGIYTNVAEQNIADVSAYWDSYQGANLENRLYEQLQPPQHGEIGVCLPYQKSEKGVYLFGVMVENFDKVTSDMLIAEIPAATNVVFTTPPVNNLNTATTYDKDPLAISVKETWRYIFAEWFAQCSYNIDETKYAFELYDKRCHASENAVMSIYVPIKTKGNGDVL